MRAKQTNHTKRIRKLKGLGHSPLAILVRGARLLTGVNTSVAETGFIEFHLKCLKRVCQIASNFNGKFYLPLRSGHE